jgi:hypothetical protein
MLLKSHRNDYPEVYKEVKIAHIIGPNQWSNAYHALDKLMQDIKQNGLLHPIVLWDYLNQGSLRFFIGGKRLWCAIKLGYTRISVYHARTLEEAKAIHAKTYDIEFATR